MLRNLFCLRICLKTIEKFYSGPVGKIHYFFCFLVNDYGYTFYINLKKKKNQNQNLKKISKTSVALSKYWGHFNCNPLNKHYKQTAHEAGQLIVVIFFYYLILKKFKQLIVFVLLQVTFKFSD